VLLCCAGGFPFRQLTVTSVESVELSLESETFPVTSNTLPSEAWKVYGKGNAVKFADTQYTFELQESDTLPNGNTSSHILGEEGRPFCLEGKVTTPTILAKGIEVRAY